MPFCNDAWWRWCWQRMLAKDINRQLLSQTSRYFFCSMYREKQQDRQYGLLPILRERILRPGHFSNFCPVYCTITRLTSKMYTNANYVLYNISTDSNSKITGTTDKKYEGQVPFCHTQRRWRQDFSTMEYGTESHVSAVYIADAHDGKRLFTPKHR